MPKPITLVVADSGPLISLAIAERTDLLNLFGVPIHVLDIVREECLRKPDSPGEPELKHWFAGNKDKIDIIKSPIIGAYHEAVEREIAGIEPHATEGLGDAAISWFIVQAPRRYGSETISLILTEDGPFGDTRLDRSVHVLSTRPFLQTLENMNLIPSAQTIISDIEAKSGRRVARYAADRPALIGRTGRTRSNWTDTVKRKAGSGIAD
ncbi:MAG: hypothetical protein WDN02_15130 [Methylovirgula sp.]|uniref:hypothetical protein n=1 Tax=Methylovirgula sp. TaxID=1978224 RepID=UPI003076593E